MARGPRPARITFQCSPRGCPETSARTPWRPPSSACGCPGTISTTSRSAIPPMRQSSIPTVCWTACRRSGPLRYEPQPFGLPSAREAVSAEYARRGVRGARRATSCSRPAAARATRCCSSCSAIPASRCWSPRRATRSSSTSRASTACTRCPYRTEYHGTWTIDLEDLRYAIDETTRAILVVSPNNPTGQWLKREELAALVDVCAAHHLVLIGDEVFADYPIDPAPGAVRSVLDQGDVLTVSLGGLSKSVGLPQLKLGWMALRGPPPLLQSALMRLEIATDAYLSVGTPVQVAASAAAQGRARRQASDSTARREQLPPLAGGCRPAPVLPGASRGRRVVGRPADPAHDARGRMRRFALLERQHLLVHPGYFFDFPRDGYLVVSLLTRPDVFRARHRPSVDGRLHLIGQRVLSACVHNRLSAEVPALLSRCFRCTRRAAPASGTSATLRRSGRGCGARACVRCSCCRSARCRPARPRRIRR